MSDHERLRQQLEHGIITRAEYEAATADTLTGVQQPPDEHSEWCSICARWHQRRDRPIRCTTIGCTTMTDSYHGKCSQHRQVSL